MNRTELTMLVALGITVSAAAAGAAPRPPTGGITQASGITVSTGRTADGAAAVHVATEALDVRKVVYSDATSLTIKTRGGDTVELTVTTAGITVRRNARALRITKTSTEEDYELVRDLFRRSPAVRLFRALAGALPSGGGVDALSLSGAIVGFLDGDPSAVSRHATAALRRGGLRRASQTSQECWDSYSRDASRIAAEYEVCMDHTSWYEMLERASCQLEYVVRAEMAFSWLIACNGGFLGGD